MASKGFFNVIIELLYLQADLEIKKNLNSRSGFQVEFVQMSWILKSFIALEPCFVSGK